MSYLDAKIIKIETEDVRLNEREVYWKVVPKNTPYVTRNCPKCGNNATYINTKKFRVNANKKTVDIWLIYQCRDCKSTWNLTIFDRINLGSIDHVLYERFLANDEELAFEYGYDYRLHQRSKTILKTDYVEFEVVRDIGRGKNLNKSEYITHVLTCDYNIPVKITKILSEILDTSTTRIKKLYNEKLITLESTKDINKVKLGHGIKVMIKETER